MLKELMNHLEKGNRVKEMLGRKPIMARGIMATDIFNSLTANDLTQQQFQRSSAIANQLNRYAHQQNRMMGGF